MPVAQLYPSFSGFHIASKSLQRPPAPYFSIRLKPLDSLGMDANRVVYGDKATPDFLDTLAIVWGGAVPPTADRLQSGYAYIYNVGHGKLYIYDASNQLVVTREINAWSDFKLAAEVIESNQFQFFFDASFHECVFIPASRQPNADPGEAPEFVWGEFDKYLQSEYHIIFTRLCRWLLAEAERPARDKSGEPDVLDGLTVPDCEYEGVLELRDFLLALVRDLTQSGYFRCNIAPYSNELAAPKEWKELGGLATAIGNYLMIYALSASLFLGNKPCYEPWMLWQMFKWLQRSSLIELDERVFDLSPRW